MVTAVVKASRNSDGYSPMSEPRSASAATTTGTITTTGSNQRAAVAPTDDPIRSRTQPSSGLSASTPSDRPPSASAVGIDTCVKPSTPVSGATM